ncbi:MAG: formate dehydrogenase subunit delta [Hyphomicrobium sp.]
MDNGDIVRMANQITAFFAAYPKGEAIDGIAKHVHLFWDPRMRNQLKSYVDTGGKDLEPLFLEAAHDYFKGPKTPAAKAIISKDKAPSKGA